MRYFAVTLLLAAMGAAGYLAWTGLHQTPEVIPSGEVKTVRVDNFAYASPELVKPENLKVEAPAVRDEAVQAAEAAVEVWISRRALQRAAAPGSGAGHAEVLAAATRAASRSSIRTRCARPVARAISHESSPVRRLPRCRSDVGLGAKRPAPAGVRELTDN